MQTTTNARIACIMRDKLPSWAVLSSFAAMDASCCCSRRCTTAERLVPMLADAKRRRCAALARKNVVHLTASVILILGSSLPVFVKNGPERDAGAVTVFINGLKVTHGYAAQ